MGLYSSGEFSDPLFFFNGNTRVIAHFLLEARKLVENGGLTRIGISYEGYIDIFTHGYRGSSRRSISICTATDLRMAIWDPFTFM
jgi:hypothetical protein